MTEASAQRGTPSNVADHAELPPGPGCLGRNDAGGHRPRRHLPLQVETGTSNGGLTAHPGGDRWRWEKTLFDGAYDAAPTQERPKYGALNHHALSLGGAPRFGSAYLRLAEHCSTAPPSASRIHTWSREHFGTAHRFDLLGFAEELDATERDPHIEHRDGDLLDGYIEAQVHGVIDGAHDAEARVPDPCYQGTRVEAAAPRLEVPVEWHEGRVLTLAQLDQHDYYRDLGAIELGHRIALNQHLDARIIGDAARTGRYRLQSIKQVWHLVARFGSPRWPARLANYGQVTVPA